MFVSCKKSLLPNPFPVKHTTGSRINASTVHAEILLSQKSQKTVLHAENGRVFIGKQMR